MSTLLILTVLVLVAIAIWQMTKIFELSQLKADQSVSEIANDSDNNYNGYLLFGFLIFIYGITIFSFAKYYKFLLPEAASEHGAGYDKLMWISFAIIFFVQTITQALLHYYGYKYRGKEGKKALFFADNDRLEFIWTIIPVIVLAGLIIWDACNLAANRLSCGHPSKADGYPAGHGPRHQDGENRVRLSELHFPVSNITSLAYRKERDSHKCAK